MSMKTVTFMATGNAVKVTHTDDDTIDTIGVIIGQYEPGFAKVNFGTHTAKVNINSLLDLTYSYYEN